MKKVIALLLSVMLMLSLAACEVTEPKTTDPPANNTSGSKETAGNQTEPAATTEQPEDKVRTIGWTIMFMDESKNRFLTGYQGYFAQKPGWEIYFVSCEGDSAKQVTDVENLITMGCDGIVITEIDKDTSAACVDLCKDAGIFNAGSSTALASTPDWAFGIDTYQLGLTHADMINEWHARHPDIVLKAGYMLGSVEQDQTWVTKQGGWDGCFTQAAEDGWCEIIAEDTADWLTADAVTLCENWLTAYPEMNCVIAQNDDMAIGAIQAAKSAGYKLGENFFVFGKDGNAAGIEAMKAGELEGSVYLSFEGWGYSQAKMFVEAIEAAEEAIANGEEFEHGKGEVLYIDPETSWRSIFPDNVDEVIAYFEGLTAELMG